MFGGRAAASGPYYGDLWECDTATAAPGTSARRPARRRPRCPTIARGHAMVYDTGDARRRSCSAAGSRAPASSSRISGSGTAARRRGRSTRWWRARQPTPRFGASMVWDSRPQRAVLFGGFDETTGRLNDIWEWNGTRPGRTGRRRGTKPSPRHSAMIVYDSARGKTVLYSGNTGTGRRAARPAAPGSTRSGSGTAPPGRWTAHHRARRSTMYAYGYSEHRLRRQHEQDRPLLLLRTRSGSTTRRRRPWATVTTHDADQGRHQHAALLSDAAIVYDSGTPEAGDVRRPVRTAARCGS